MREMTAQGIIQFKSGSKERGNIWQTITKNPNYHKNFFNSVTSRGVRDRFTIILKLQKDQNLTSVRMTRSRKERNEELTETPWHS